MIRQVVAHKATGPDCVTVLRALGERWTTVDSRLVRRPLRLTKLIAEDGIEDYDRAQLFDPSAWQLDGVEDLHELLTILEPQTDACVVRGAVKVEAAARAAVYRRYAARHGDAAMFKAADRRWLMVELDSIPCPAGVDPCDPEMAGGAARRVLPLEFRSARCAVQLSSGAGIKPGLRVHLWFWLDRPVSDAEAKRWLKAAPVDCSIYQPVGIHYVARPVFADDLDDPCHERLGLLPGYAEVAVPALPDRQRATFTAFDPCLGARGSAGAERYAMACLRRLALAPEGQRHRICVAVSCRLMALAKAGLLDPLRAASQIKGVMLGKGFDGRSGRDLGEIDRILEWAWQTVGPEGLPHG